MSDHFFDPVRPRARKAHRCIGCMHPIQVGEVHLYQRGFYDGHAFSNRFHTECWNYLSHSGEFEFLPGELDPPERLKHAANTSEVQ